MRDATTCGLFPVDDALTCSSAVYHEERLGSSWPAPPGRVL